MQRIKQLQKGLSVLEFTHRHGYCPAVTSPATKSFFSKTCKQFIKLANDSESTDSSSAADDDQASTARSTEFNVEDASQRYVGNGMHVTSSWKKKGNYSSSEILLNADNKPQFGSTQPWRTLSTNSANHISKCSSTDNTQDRRPDQQLMNCENCNSSKLSGTSALGQKDPKPMPQPPDPETCCESGCVNCVWIRYVQELMEHSPDDKEQIKKVLDLIEDYNVKMFVKMELDL